MGTVDVALAVFGGHDEFERHRESGRPRTGTRRHAQLTPTTAKPDAVGNDVGRRATDATPMVLGEQYTQRM